MIPYTSNNHFSVIVASSQNLCRMGNMSVKAILLPIAYKNWACVSSNCNPTFLLHKPRTESSGLHKNVISVCSSLKRLHCLLRLGTATSCWEKRCDFCIPTIFKTIFLIISKVLQRPNFEFYHYLILLITNRPTNNRKYSDNKRRRIWGSTMQTSVAYGSLNFIRYTHQCV